MSSESELVEVPFDNAGDQAILLLAAAEEEGLEPSVVQTTTGAFRVPKSLADKAFSGDTSKRAEQLRAEQEERGSETHVMGAGQTGRIDTNAGEDAEQGSVQADESEAEGHPSEGRAKKSAAKKSSPKKDQE